MPLQVYTIPHFIMADWTPRTLSEHRQEEAERNKYCSYLENYWNRLKFVNSMKILSQRTLSRAILAVCLASNLTIKRCRRYLFAFIMYLFQLKVNGPFHKPQVPLSYMLQMPRTVLAPCWYGFKLVTREYLVVHLSRGHRLQKSSADLVHSALGVHLLKTFETQSPTQVNR
jgi:hypothetical protein